MDLVRDLGRAVGVLLAPARTLEAMIAARTLELASEAVAESRLRRRAWEALALESIRSDGSGSAPVEVLLEVHQPSRGRSPDRQMSHLG